MTGPKLTPVTIKKYANRRLYHTGISSYVTLEDLAEMVRKHEEFVVVDAKTGDEITHSVLTQIIFEEETKGQNLLPIPFLRQLISFYGDSLQSFLPSYLEQSLSMFTKEQNVLKASLAQAFTPTTMASALTPAAMTVAFEEQAKKNIALFEKTMRMFSILPDAGGTNAAQQEGVASAQNSNELDALKSQIADMQQQLKALSQK